MALVLNQPKRRVRGLRNFIKLIAGSAGVVKVAIILIALIAGIGAKSFLKKDSPVEQEIEHIAEEIIEYETGIDVDL